MSTVPEQSASLGAFLAVTVGVAVLARREGLGWKDVGFSGTNAWSVPMALALSVLLIWGYGPLALWIVRATEPRGLVAAVAKLQQLPRWYLLLSIVLVASAEEWLYRGYAIDRLIALTGRSWLAGLISVTAFAAAHLPLWGLGLSLASLLTAALFTGLYLWRRDVVLLIVAHVFTDAYGLVCAPSGSFG